MSSLLNYIYTLYYPVEVQNTAYHSTENIDTDYSIINKKYLISKDDLEKVNLKSVNDIVPGPSRNMPLLDKTNLKSLNKAPLDIIMSVKLKPIPLVEKKTFYIPRHPVLKELLEKFHNLEQL